MPSPSALFQACQQWKIPRKLTLLIAFGLLLPWKEALARNVASKHAISHSPARFAIVAVLKLLILSGYYVFRKRSSAVAYRGIATFEEGRADARVGGLWRPTAWVPSILMLAVASSHAIFDYLFTSHMYTEGLLPYTQAQLVAIPVTTVVLPIATACLLRRVERTQLQGLLLQSCGILFVLTSLFSEVNMKPHSFALGVFTAMVFVITEHLCHTHPQLNFDVLGIPLFIMGAVIHSIIALVKLTTVPEVRQTYLFSSGFPPLSVPMLFLVEAVSDQGTLALAVIWSMATVVTSGGSLLDISNVSLGLLVAFALLLYGGATFLSAPDALREEIEEEPAKNTWQKTLVVISLTAITAFIAAAAMGPSAVSPTFPAPHGQPAPITSTCQRKPLKSQFFYDKPRTYHHFDHVLLIVFFSHARYGANLDYYKEVYSEYFPNMVFIGPASREDAGFSHSYDLMVDSYQSDEDLSNANFYKMAGRMAHHMLYTAMMEHNCYDGYLWAPFDTLLNIPRLQLFDQTKFWYYSPWGKYVPNPQVKADGNGGKHAPPARISPDPALNLTESWQGWAKDWCDPHVGSATCMEAFNKVPEAMRSRMALFTEGKTRLIGGSADTVYIPGRHRDNFLDILALFLETDCFLEIAVPTTIHLVLPPNEDILYLDHWWIWEPPFNATYVRQRWEEGYEVDTFHTFHWGEKDASGVWRGNHDHVADIQHLQKESAMRQGLRLD
ncbi:hypothetical protein EYR36_005141 [Pleurotus pulmonarius]|nr:hypothetical protein EYR36_005141 [Pleurotus pulmonarius]